MIDDTLQEIEDHCCTNKTIVYEAEPLQLRFSFKCVFCEKSWPLHLNDIKGSSRPNEFRTPEDRQKLVEELNKIKNELSGLTKDELLMFLLIESFNEDKQ